MHESTSALYRILIIILICKMDLFVSNAMKVFPKVVCVGKNYLQHVKEMGGS